MSASDVLSKINEYGVKFVDFRFTDTKGKEQHVSVPAHTIEERLATTVDWYRDRTDWWRPLKGDRT